jgi:hypothetical protein
LKRYTVVGGGEGREENIGSEDSTEMKDIFQGVK